MNINSQNVDVFYDLIDEACMEYYNDLRLDYLDAFCRVASDILDEIDDSNLSDEAIVKLSSIYEKIYNLNILNEEIRLAIVLILIKGLKHRNLGLDVVTPDSIGYLYTYIIELLTKGKKASVIDTSLGISSLSQTILNNLPGDIDLVGIESDDTFVNVSKAFSDLLDNNIKIYYQEPTKEVYDVADIVIGDLDRVEDKYELILERLVNIKDNGYFVYLIDNDFFNAMKPGFKESLIKYATLTGLIVLPENMTNSNHIGKSILIGKKAALSDYHMSILKIESFVDGSIATTFKKIKNMIEQMEE